MDLDHHAWPVDQKIDTYLHSGWHTWGQYLDDTIAPARHAWAALPAATDVEAHNQNMLAIHQWTKEAGCEVVELHKHEDGRLNLLWHALNQAPQPLDASLTSPSVALIGDQAASQGQPDTALVALVHQAERDWVASSPDAPVVKVMFQGEEDIDGYIQSVEEGGAWEWDGTQSLMELPPGERSDAMERDTYASDTLRDHDQAAEEAKEWDGPYKVEALIFRPSAALRAARAAATLDDTTPAASSPIARPRI